jgi:tungstate transport system ATP-binding protein
MNHPVYSLKNVVKEYDGRRVLQVDGLDIQCGEVFALVGPNGAGKSTLLRLLNFLEPPTFGRIQFSDFQFKADNMVPLDIQRRVTTVFQRPLLLNRSVRDNVDFGLRLRGEKNTKTKTDAVLDQVGLVSLAYRRARTLSGGEAQRVALARALVLQPDVLLMDEPTANLDPYNVGLIEDIIRNLAVERAMTLVLVTHNTFQAHRLADRVGLLLEGRLIETADVEDFFETPRDPRTAAFVRGDMVY